MQSPLVYFNNIGSTCTYSLRHGNGLSALLLLTRAAKSSAAKSSASKTRSMESRLNTLGETGQTRTQHTSGCTDQNGKKFAQQHRQGYQVQHLRRREENSENYNQQCDKNAAFDTESHLFLDSALAKTGGSARKFGALCRPYSPQQLAAYIKPGSYF